MPTTYAIPNGRTVFGINLWSGTNTTNVITNQGAFKPDLVWIKARTSTANYAIVDSYRGVTKQLQSSTTNTESTNSAGKGIQTLNSSGFTLGQESDATGGTNASGVTYVGWQWNSNGGSFSSNTNGSVTSQVSVNTAAGFSVCAYTVPSPNFTWGHGLPAAPQFIIVKGGYTTQTYNWDVYHASLGPTVRLVLNSSSTQQTYSGPWNDTTPTATLVSQQGGASGWYATGSLNIAYCFTPIAGFSSFGKWTGNGSSDGPFIYTGFKPAFILYKAASGSAYYWGIYDTTRQNYNVQGYNLSPNSVDVDSVYSYLDILSNGFKIRAIGNLNENGATYVYAAFAENPFKYANAG